MLWMQIPPHGLLRKSQDCWKTLTKHPGKDSASKGLLYRQEALLQFDSQHPGECAFLTYAYAMVHSWFIQFSQNGS